MPEPPWLRTDGYVVRASPKPALRPDDQTVNSPSNGHARPGAFHVKRLPAPGSRLPAPGSRLPAPGSRLPAPGSRLPAPGSRLPAIIKDTASRLSFHVKRGRGTGKRRSKRLHPRAETRGLGASDSPSAEPWPRGHRHRRSALPRKLRPNTLSLRAQGSGLRAQGSGLRAQGSGLRAQGFPSLSKPTRGQKRTAAKRARTG
jgi:hypothetical protein